MATSMIRRLMIPAAAVALVWTPVLAQTTVTEKAADTAKKTGDAVVDMADKAVDATAEAAKKTGDAVVDMAKDVPEGVKVVTAEGVAGGSMSAEHVVTANVTALNKETRQITLKGEEGNEVTMVAGPAMLNFDQLEVGDKVRVTVTQQLQVHVADKAEREDGLTGIVAAPEVGEKPGIFVGDVTSVSGKIKSIDAAARTAVLEFADGTEQTFKVRPDVKLDNYKAGQVVLFDVIETLAVEVNPKP